MPQQSNESSAKTDAYGRIECQDCGGRFHPEPHELSGIHICGPMVVRLQATIKDLQERSEKHGNVIKDLKSQLEYSNGILEVVKGDAHAMAIGQLKENQFVLNSISKDLLP